MADINEQAIQVITRQIANATREMLKDATSQILKTIEKKNVDGANIMPFSISKSKLMRDVLSKVTPTADGLMSKEDKEKLDAVAENANNYTHPTSAGNKHLPSGGSLGQILRWSANGTGVWGTDNNTTYNPATPSANGLMSAADKNKLNEFSSADKYALKSGAVLIDAQALTTAQKAQARENMGLGTAAVRGVRNALTQAADGFVLDARQGKALKDMIDAGKWVLLWSGSWGAAGSTDLTVPDAGLYSYLAFEVNAGYSILRRYNGTVTVVGYQHLSSDDLRILSHRVDITTSGTACTLALTTSKRYQLSAAGVLTVVDNPSNAITRIWGWNP